MIRCNSMSHTIMQPMKLQHEDKVESFLTSIGNTMHGIPTELPISLEEHIIKTIIKISKGNNGNEK